MAKEFSLTRSIERVLSNAPAKSAQTVEALAFGQRVPELSFNVPWDGIRGMTAASFPAGGAMVGTSRGSLADALRPASFVIAAGALVIEATGNLMLPRWSSAVTASWLAEYEAAPSVDPELAGLNLAPRRVGCTATFSRQLFHQTGGDIEEFVRRELRNAIAQAIDGAVCAGAGGKEPIGILNAPGVGTDVTFGGAATWDHILTFEEAVGLDNAEDPAALYVTSHQTRRKWKKKERAAGSGFIWECREVNSYAAHATNFLSATHQAIFGNFKEVVIASWGGGFNVVVDPYTLAATGQIKLIADALLDVGIRRPQEFCISTDAGNQ